MRRVAAVLRAWMLRALLAFAGGSAGIVLLYRFVDPPLTPLMVTRAIGSAVAGRPRGIDQRWVELDRVSPSLLRAVIAAEDARFFEHRGFDTVEIERAWESNQRGEGLRGASTITMQCARNVFLWQGRTWLRKALEAWFTVLLELGWSKHRILEVYLNVIEWGDGIYGAEAAARAYFGMPSSRLDAGEAALLAAALPSPSSSNPAAPSARLRARAARIQARAREVDLARLASTRSSRR